MSLWYAAPVLGRAMIVGGILGAAAACGTGAAPATDGAPAADGGGADDAGDAAAPDAAVPVTLAEVPSGQVRDLIAVDGVVYWLDGGLPVGGDNGRTMRVDVDGLDQRALAEGLSYPRSPVVIAGTLFWLAGDGSIMSVPVDGSAAAAELANGGTALLGLASDGDYLYWTEHLNPTGRVARMPIQEGVIEDIATAQPDPAQLAVSGSTVYFALQYELRQVPASGGLVDWFADATFAMNLLVVDGSVYWRAGDTGAFTIERRAVGGATPVELVASVDRGGGLAVDAAFVYYGEDLDGLGSSPTSIWRAPRDGSGVPERLHDNLPYVGAIVQEGDYLYAATPGSILKLPK